MQEEDIPWVLDSLLLITVALFVSALSLTDIDKFKDTLLERFKMQGCSDDQSERVAEMFRATMARVKEQNLL